jgi:hypothetical protein
MEHRQTHGRMAAVVLVGAASAFAALPAATQATGLRGGVDHIMDGAQRQVDAIGAKIVPPPQAQPGSTRPRARAPAVSRQSRGGSGSQRRRGSATQSRARTKLAGARQAAAGPSTRTPRAHATSGAAPGAPRTTSASPSGSSAPPARAAAAPSAAAGDAGGGDRAQPTKVEEPGPISLPFTGSRPLQALALGLLLALLGVGLARVLRKQLRART